MENLTSNAEQILTNIERDNILRVLFKGKEGELDASFLYKGKGAELYENISKDPSYPYIDIEKWTLRNFWGENEQKFKRVLEHTEYITDIGCGDGQKAISLLKNRFRSGTYIAEDYSGEMLNIAERNVREELSNVKLGSSQKLNDGKHLSQRCPNNMYLFLGGTICNMSDEDIINELKNMDNNGIISGNKILLSYFTAPTTQKEIDNLIKIYNSESNRAFHENGMNMLGLSKDDFEYDTVYELEDPKKKEGPFPGRIKGIIRAKRDNIVKLSSGEEIHIKEGQEFTIHYSRRFTKEKIEELFKKSSCNVVFTVDKEGDSIALLNKKPSALTGFIKKNQKALWVALAALGIGFGGGVLANQHYKEQKEEQKVRSSLDLKLRGGKSIDQYNQETNELIAALSLEELNRKDKEIIISLFNKYIAEHGEGGESNENLIMGFYKEYGWILINNFSFTHSPYDFFDIGTSTIFGPVSWLITNTLRFEEKGNEFSVTPDYIIGNKVHFRGLGGLDYGNFSVEEIMPSRGRSKSPAFEYNDGGKRYSILKVSFRNDDGELTEIYVGAKKDKNIKYPEFSTDIINEMHNKSGLDPEIVSNTNKLGSFKLVGKVNADGHEITPEYKSKNGKGLRLENTDENMVIQRREGSIVINKVYVGGKLYYFIKLPTGEAGSSKINNIGLASTSIKGPFTTSEFNKMAKEFLKKANIGTYYLGTELDL